jgi:phosphate transport system substrate-binding protein
MKTQNLLTAFALAAIAPGLQAQSAVTPPPNAGVSIWTQNVTGFRKEHGSKGGYTKQWDLSDLPHYAPTRQVTGTLRIWGSNYLKDGSLGESWREGFKKFQPGVTLDYHLPTEAMAIPALVCGVADIGVSNRGTLTDLLSFEQMYHYPVTAIPIMTGSYDVYGWSPAYIFAVNKDNPLTQVSMKQLDGIFGCARTGGYVGTVWHSEYPYSRGPEENIRTWDQLGLTGEWVGKPIHIGGQNARAGTMTGFSDVILKGSALWAEGYRGFTNYITTGAKIVTWSAQARDALEKDRYAIYYVSPLSMSPDLKELAVQGYDGGPYVHRTLETVHDRTYPLYTQQYFFVNRPAGKPVDPMVEEFVRYVLSQEGQECVESEGRYLPLTADVVQGALGKLE